MPSASHIPAIQSLEIDISIIKGRDLVAKDRGGLLSKKKKTSDPFVKIFWGGKKYEKQKQRIKPYRQSGMKASKSRWVQKKPIRYLAASLNTV